jgi:HTH-type transcriptional regulator/antitoxin HigA
MSHTLRIIKTEREYDKALSRIYDLMQAKIKTKSSEADELELLSLLVKDYEDKHYHLSLPNPIEAIKFRMDQLGLGPADLSNMLGSRSRKSDILNGRRKLTLEMIRTLYTKLSIPAETLIQEY